MTAPTAPSPAPETVLSEREMYRLTLWKWAYAAECAGWAPVQARRLVFARYLRARGKLTS